MTHKKKDCLEVRVKSSCLYMYNEAISKYLYPRYFHRISCFLTGTISIVLRFEKKLNIYYSKFIGVISKVNIFYYWIQMEFIGNVPYFHIFYALSTNSKSSAHGHLEYVWVILCSELHALFKIPENQWCHRKKNFQWISQKPPQMLCLMFILY